VGTPGKTGDVNGAGEAGGGKENDIYERKEREGVSRASPKYSTLIWKRNIFIYHYYPISREELSVRYTSGSDICHKYSRITVYVVGPFSALELDSKLSRLESL